MPRHPRLSSRSSGLGGSVFEKHVARSRAQVEAPIKLHIGDTHLPPPYALPLDKGFRDRHPHLFEYGNTHGVRPLRQAIGEKLGEDNALVTRPEQVLVTAGASNALSIICQTLLDPGEEVIVLTPAWPFFFGMVRAAGGKVRQLPLYMHLYADPSFDVAGSLRNAISPETVAVYVNSPNNPSGKLLDREQMAAIVDVARRNDLWIIADEAYDGLVYGDPRDTALAAHHDDAGRVLSVFTFSKLFRFAGLRLGWIRASTPLIPVLNGLMVHQLYGPSIVGQYMMLEPLRTRREWSPKVRREYQSRRDRMIRTLEFEVPLPQGGTFVFFSVEPFLGGRSMEELVGTCLDEGLLIAPGGDFGENFALCARLCFTAESPDRTEEGIRRLNRILLG